MASPPILERPIRLNSHLPSPPWLLPQASFKSISTYAHCHLLFQWKWYRYFYSRQIPQIHALDFYTSLLVILFHIYIIHLNFSTIITTSTCKYLRFSSWNKQIKSLNFVLPSRSNPVSLPSKPSFSKIHIILSHSFLTLPFLLQSCFRSPCSFKCQTQGTLSRPGRNSIDNPFVTDTPSFLASHHSTGSSSLTSPSSYPCLGSYFICSLDLVQGFHHPKIICALELDKPKLKS